MGKKKTKARKVGRTASSNEKYWRANIRLVQKLLAVWFLVSYVFSILLVDSLDKIQFFGFKLGFWFAQQGSIYVFVVLIFVYVWRIGKLDRKFKVSED